MDFVAECQHLKEEKPFLEDVPKGEKNSLSPAVENKVKTLEHKEFQNLFSSGKKIRTNPWFFISYKKSPDLKVGWTLPRKMGGAVVRNRFKRWLKTLLKQEKGLFFHINFVFTSADKSFMKTMTYERFSDEFKRAVQKLKSI